MCAVRRISREEMLPTYHLILIFDTPALPERIRAGYLSCRVHPSIPNPLRCFKCQRFVHSKGSCQSTLKCARCGESNHESDSCATPAKCTNCKGDHYAFSRSYPVWMFEKEVQVVKVLRNLSFSDARTFVKARTPRELASHAFSV